MFGKGFYRKHPSTANWHLPYYHFSKWRLNPGNALNSSGTAFEVPRTVLDSDGNLFVVDEQALNSSATGFFVF
jgi:hypothetical protein